MKKWLIILTQPRYRFTRILKLIKLVNHLSENGYTVTIQRGEAHETIII